MTTQRDNESLFFAELADGIESAAQQLASFAVNTRVQPEVEAGDDVRVNVNTLAAALLMAGACMVKAFERAEMMEQARLDMAARGDRGA